MYIVVLQPKLRRDDDPKKKTGLKKEIWELPP